MKNTDGLVVVHRRIQQKIKERGGSDFKNSFNCFTFTITLNLKKKKVNGDFEIKIF